MDSYTSEPGVRLVEINGTLFRVQQLQDEPDQMMISDSDLYGGDTPSPFDVTRQDDGTFVLKLQVNPRFFGLIIGKGGKKKKQLSSKLIAWDPHCETQLC